MKKINENENIVSYSFDMLVINKEYYKPNEFFPYKVESHRAYGYCTLNQETNEFTVDQEKTDPYFLTIGKRAALRVERILNEILDSGENFPETTCYAA